MKRVAVLGSTGSIGKNTLNVARHLKEFVEVKALAAFSDIETLKIQIREFSPEMVAVFDREKAGLLKKEFPTLRVLSGKEGLDEVASHSDIDFVVVAISGMSALSPTVHAIQAKKGIGLANKEVLVAAGEYITDLARQNGVQLIPIDSEHSAIFQCLHGEDISQIRKIILTASGGPFRKYSLKELQGVTLESALNHPTWNMGPKITVDSSTLMNKGLEMIEAKWLFDIPAHKIEVVVHPQSIIHSFVEWIDGCIVAEMSEPDMCFPIQYALTYPKRREGLKKPFDFMKNSFFEFFPPDYNKFPALELAREALNQKPSFSCYMNAANEILVDRFLKKEIAWIEIVKRLEKLVSRHNSSTLGSIEAILTVDQMARLDAETI